MRIIKAKDYAEMSRKAANIIAAQVVAKLVGTNTIACSGSNMWACLLNTLSWGIPEEEAVLAATYNPACALGVQNEVGSIAEGLVADFLVCTDGYQSKRVFLAGKEM